MDFSKDQLELIESDASNSVFLSGLAGTGKTTTGTERMKYLLSQGIPGHSILLLFPQRTLSLIFQDTLNEISISSTSLPVIATFGGLARRGLELFWPVIADQAGFHHPELHPTFLTLESSIYFLSRIVTPLITDKGFFSSVTIQRNRLFSQVLDNLNKSAVHGFSHTEIAHRLKSSWIGDPVQVSVFDDAQESAKLFREYCFEHTLLDYSLQIELFTKHLSSNPLYLNHFNQQFDHLIFDNIEEDVPVAHDFITRNLSQFDSSLLIYDQEAGYRSFLGASPASALEINSTCDKNYEFKQSFSSSAELIEFNNLLTWSLLDSKSPPPKINSQVEKKISISYHPFYPELISWVADEVTSLIHDGTSPGSIVIIAPYLSDAMRFLLTSELEIRQIKSTSHRPSRALRDEPVTNCLLTLAALAHPDWEIKLSRTDIAQTFFQAFEQLDLTRAYLLAKHVILRSGSKYNLIDFDNIEAEAQERITYYIGSLYQNIFDWISAYQQQSPLPLDHFLIRLFGEILSQPGYGFHGSHSKGLIAEQIIDSINKFRGSAGNVLGFSEEDLGEEYYRMVKAGLLANQYPRSWQSKPEDSVYLSPAYTYLLSNTPADYQFWLDVGSRGWYERIFQPLTNPHILNRSWNVGKLWRDVEELELNLGTIKKISSGLIRRCRIGLYFCLTETDERGFEQKGLLIQALSKTTQIIRNNGSYKLN